MSMEKAVLQSVEITQEQSALWNLYLAKNSNPGKETKRNQQPKEKPK